MTTTQPVTSTKGDTFGYAQMGAEQQLETLLQEPSILLIDTRTWPTLKPGKGRAYWVATWDRTALEKKYGDRYRWCGAFLGNPNAFNDGPLAIAVE